MALLRIGDALRRLSAVDARSAGLTPAQAQTLLFVRRTKSFLATVGRLAQFLGATHPTAVGVVEGLVARGLLGKTRDPADGRVTLLSLTPAGEEVCSGLSRWLARLEADLARLGPGELDALERGLGAVVRSLQASGALAIGAPCRGCVHFHEDAAPGAAEPHYCDLVRRRVSEEEARKECPDHRPRDVV